MRGGAGCNKHGGGELIKVAMRSLEQTRRRSQTGDGDGDGNGVDTDNAGRWVPHCSDIESRADARTMRGMMRGLGCEVGPGRKKDWAGGKRNRHKGFFRNSKDYRIP